MLPFGKRNAVRFAVLCTALLSVQSQGQAAGPPAAVSEPGSKAAASPQNVHVVDVHGQPVTSAIVELQLPADAPLPDLVHETTATITDSEGSFSMPSDVPKGSIGILRKDGLGLAAFAVDHVPQKIMMQAPAVLGGSVIDDSGTSLSDVVLGPIAPPTQCEHGPGDSPHPDVMPLIFARTDAKGMFSVPGLPNHNYTFTVQAPGLQPSLVKAHTGRPLQLMLNHGGTTITGKLIGTQDHQPQAGYYIEASDGTMRLYEGTDQEGNFAFSSLPHHEWLFRPYLGPAKGQQGVQSISVGEAGKPTTLTLQLNQGALIAGKVVDDETSQPMQSVAIGLTAGRVFAQAPTDTNGDFRFDDMDMLENYSLRFDTMRYVRVLPNGETRDYYELPPNSDREHIELRLRKRAPVKGRVVDAAGTAVADAEVKLQALDAQPVRTGKPGDDRRERPEFQTTTDASGAFNIGVYPTGRFEVSATANNLAAQPKLVEAFTTAAAGEVELRLQPMVSLGGVVLDQDDNPVTGAMVLAMPAGAPGSAVPSAYQISRYPNSFTDQRGEFAIKGLAANQQVVLSASHPDFVRPASATFSAGSAAAATTDSVRLRFPQGGELGVKVTDNAGTPVPDAEVTVQFAEGLEGEQAARATNRNGLLTLRSIPANRIERIVVRHEAFAEYDSSKPIPLPQLNLTIQLKRKTTLLVNLTGAGGQPAPSSGMSAVLLAGPQQMGAPSDAQQQPASDSFSEQNRAGFVQGRATFPNLSPGWYKAALSGESGYVESPAIYISGDTQTAELNMEVPAAVVLRGSVSDKASGRPVAGAAVTITPVAQINQTDQSVSRTAYSDASGKFEFSSGAQGTVQVKVVAFGYPEYDERMEAASGQPLQIVLSNAPGGLSGTITLAGHPVENALLVLAKRGTTERPIASAVTDVAGRYALSGFSSGKYDLTVEAPAGSDQSTTRRTLPVSVTGLDSRKDIDLPALVHVTGSVRLAGKAPVHTDGSAATVLFTPKEGGGDGRAVTLNKDGSFSTDIEPGTYNVGIEDRVGQDVVITEQATQNLNLAF